MSFQIDPPLLYASGEAYARLAPEEAQGRAASVAGAATLGVFFGVGLACYLDRPWTRPLSKLFGARDGREFMLTSGIANVPRRRLRDPLTHVVAAAAFASYPLWLWLGWDHGRRARPRGPRRR